MPRGQPRDEEHPGPAHASRSGKARRFCRIVRRRCAFARLLVAASQQPDLCGRRVDAYAAFHGAFSYLDRPAPIYHDYEDVPPDSRPYNYAITKAGSGWPAVAADREMELVRVADVTRCNADPDYD